MTRDEDAAAEIVQRTFLKVLLHIDQYEGRAAFRSWVWRIAANEALIWGRERMRRERKAAALAACAAWTDHAPSPHEALERERRMERLRQALKALPPRDRTPVERTATGDRSTITRLSLHSGVCARTLRTRLFRARQRLRRSLEGEA
jgi:RNA polymerase sigma-70 factor (ECF subfamily)